MTSREAADFLGVKLADALRLREPRAREERCPARAAAARRYTRADLEGAARAQRRTRRGRAALRRAGARHAHHAHDRRTARSTAAGSAVELARDGVPVHVGRGAAVDAATLPARAPRWPADGPSFPARELARLLPAGQLAARGARARPARAGGGRSAALRSRTPRRVLARARRLIPRLAACVRARARPAPASRAASATPDPVARARDRARPARPARSVRSPCSSRRSCSAPTTS